MSLWFDLYFKGDFYCYSCDISVTIVTITVDQENCCGCDIQLNNTLKITAVFNLKMEYVWLIVCTMINPIPDGALVVVNSSPDIMRCLINLN